VFESNHAAFSTAQRDEPSPFGKLHAPDKPTILPRMAPLGRKATAEKPISGWRHRLAHIDFAPDLGEDIGSPRWFRGLATFTVLSVGALMLIPDFGPVYGAQPTMPNAAELEEIRAQMIMPIALGSDSGRRMAANDRVVALAASPERPSIAVTATLGQGDSFARVLQRAGVGGGDVTAVQRLIAGAVDTAAIAPGTVMEISLGKRTSKTAPRPLESLGFRARFDLDLAVNRAGAGFSLIRRPIATDDTPLRIKGTVGASLYRSARAAGAPAASIQSFLQILAGQGKLNSIQPSDQFDIIIDYRRSASGDTRIGELLFAGIERGDRNVVQMLKWSNGDASQWFEASGVGETRGQISRPVPGAITSSFGMRRHPLLGYMRMHSGLDFHAGYGEPIYAATDGVIAFAGRKGGYGNFIQINHAAGLATGYGHMSRFATRAGQRVRQGQVIGYIGSTGLSTGPHLHYEMYRNGRPINPMSVSFTSRAQLSGSALASFRARLASLKSVKPGAALAPLQGARMSTKTAMREIDRVGG
jgi:murein DD-endopeptidase MepM/ murein hydrolase activator NlpD